MKTSSTNPFQHQAGQINPQLAPTIDAQPGTEDKRRSGLTQSARATSTTVQQRVTQASAQVGSLFSRLMRTRKFKQNAEPSSGLIGGPLSRFAGRLATVLLNETRAPSASSRHTRAPHGAAAEATSVAPPPHNKPDSGRLANPEESVLRFFTPGTGTRDDLSIDQVLQFSDHRLEIQHDFIQRLFPTDTPSHYQPDALVLSGKQLMSLRDHALVQAGLLAGLDRMLRFYGLERSSNGIQIKRGDTRRLDAVLQPKNHHCLRISRMIRSLTLFGLSEQAGALNACLQNHLARKPASARSDWQQPIAHWDTALHASMKVETDS